MMKITKLLFCVCAVNMFGPGFFEGNISTLRAAAEQKAMNEYNEQKWREERAAEERRAAEAKK